MASALRAAGVEPGDRVGILLPNMPEFPLALNGIWLAGATAEAFMVIVVAVMLMRAERSSGFRWGLLRSGAQAA